MVDTLTPAERRERMSRVKHRDTAPEMLVRRIVHGLGYRYRLHRRDLPGCPDLVFGKPWKVIFVHGCFWHHHSDSDCKLARLPKSRRQEFFFLAGRWLRVSISATRHKIRKVELKA